ncbi:hypothetical protein H2200_002666 [Cladophialophora chaetospira]|uniref:Uncharacterized protein n=1 Tax=Cladophialophora chaetospira TaxID=386627 RepID=A0AA39CN89_9EURO|nr:hypothetical protein H2200_002666 [Cladophialophora chaetospira]
MDRNNELGKSEEPSTKGALPGKHEAEVLHNGDEERNVHTKGSSRHVPRHTLLRAIPQWYSFMAITGSALTPFVSLAILLGVRGDPVWPNSGITKVVSPASLLSALLSLNSFLISFAWAQGATSAWWRRTKTPHVTYGELHRTWVVGTSWIDALWLMDKPTFLHIVTFAVALNSITGFALQGALDTPTRTMNKQVSIPVPMAPVLDLGFSGEINPNGVIDPHGYYWQWVWQQVQNLVSSTTSQYAYFGSVDSNGNKIAVDYDDHATYTAYVDGAGFDYDCSPYNLSYDLEPTQSRPTTKGRIFQSSFYWNSTNPNEVDFDIYWKEHYGCQGSFTGRHCTLRPATVIYPVTIQMSVPGSTYPGPYYNLKTDTTRHDDKTKSILVPYPNEGTSNTTYGGIAETFVEFFNASIDIEDNYTPDCNVTASTCINAFENSSYLASGSLVDSLIGDYGNQNQYYCSLSFASTLSNLKYLDSMSKANQSFAVREGDGADIDGMADLAEIVLTTVRQAMFLSAVYTGSQALSDTWNSHDDDWLPYNKSHYLPIVSATRHKQETVYDFRWHLWAVSAFVTWVICALVLLSFGPWPGVLKTKKSLAPLETAQFFGAPAFKNARVDEGVEGILEDVGNKEV